MSSVYRTARGAILDMDRLKLANETTVAVGNSRVNARGDQLDENGNVVRPKDQIMSQHYKQGMGNVPTDMPIVESSSQAKKNRAQADVLDTQKLQETIEALTRQLAEKDAMHAASNPEVAADPIVQEEEEPAQQVDLSDEIDALLPNAAEPTADVPLRGGLASAIQKQKDNQESKGKRS